MTLTPEETLDPDEWEDMRRLAHRMVDDAIDHTSGVRTRPVWQDMPGDARAFFESTGLFRKGDAPQGAPTGGRLRRHFPSPHALSNGQHTSAVLDVVHGIEQFHRRAGPRRPCCHPTPSSATLMPVTRILTQTERKRQDTSARRAEKTTLRGKAATGSRPDPPS